MKINRTLLGSAILAAITASICCITPILAFLAGTSGIASIFSWVEPFRPFLIGLTILVLAFAWYQQLKPKTPQELDCACDEDSRTSFWQSRKFLGIVTAFNFLMLAFPYYSEVFYPETESNSAFAMTQYSKEITVNVKGMTCSGCEKHIEHALGQLEGINSVKASYDLEKATVRFSPALVSNKTIVDVINETGYRVIGEPRHNLTAGSGDKNISFYEVPMVCNAAPTIGCGSRSKPVLLDLQKAPGIQESRLNRSGAIISIVWEDGIDPGLRYITVSGVFENHQIVAKELLGDNFVATLSSFNQIEDWLNASEVDELSREEAFIIADQLIKTIEIKTKLTAENAEEIHTYATDTFNEFFLNFETLADLGDAKIYQAKLKDIWTFGENLLGKGKMPSPEELWGACSNVAKSCDHDSCSSTCNTPNS